MKYYDVIIIGSGPSALMNAANIENKTTLILEKNNEIGGKLKVSGGGRCNVTNKKSIEYLLKNIPKNNKFLFSTLNSFSSDNIIDFFENSSVPLKEEDDNRIFPVSNKSIDIINVFENKLKTNKTTVKTNYSVESVKIKNNNYIIDNNFICKFLIIATGGITYKHLGTTGDGYQFAKNLGHSVTKLYPVEVPLVSNDKIIQGKIIQGISLKNIKGKVIINKKVVFEKNHNILFTHFGLSGPLALQASYFVNKELQSEKRPISFILDFNDYPFDIPKKLKPLIDENNLLIFKISDIRGSKHGFITDGGIKLKEINPKNFESKIHKNLFFTGEILDINAFTGGYNITLCLSEGYSVAKYLNSIN